jgi:phosphohistidine phosphatase SixA
MIYQQLRNYFLEMIREQNLEEEAIRVRARPLSAEEAIGTPQDSDYPLLKGQERLMEARFREARGQAYSDHFGDYEGSLKEITELELTDNFRRAVFISSLNAVMRSLNLIEGTIHCRDREPEECARALDEYLSGKFGQPERMVLVGHQPRLLEALAARGRVRAVDLDPENIGLTRSGVVIEPPEDIGELIEWADLLLVTGTTVVNGTIELFLGLEKPVVFYGVTIAGPAHILNLNRFCALGH